MVTMIRAAQNYRNLEPAQNVLIVAKTHPVCIVPWELRRSMRVPNLFSQHELRGVCLCPPLHP